MYFGFVPGELPEDMEAEFKRINPPPLGSYVEVTTTSGRNYHGWLRTFHPKRLVGELWARLDCPSEIFSDRLVLLWSRASGTLYTISAATYVPPVRT